MVTWVQPGVGGGGSTAPCLSFQQTSFSSSTSWVVDLPDGEPFDFMFAWVLTTVNASATPTGWIEENADTTAYSGTRHYWWRKVRGTESDFTINFGSSASGSVLLVNAQADPDLPGDSWGGYAYNDLAGDFAGVTEPFTLNGLYGGAYDPDGSLFIAVMRTNGIETSFPGSPWVQELYGSTGSVSHQLYHWSGSGNAPNFTWDTTGTTRDISFIEIAHLCSR